MVSRDPARPTCSHARPTCSHARPCPRRAPWPGVPQPGAPSAGRAGRRASQQHGDKREPDGHWATLCLADENHLNVDKGDPKKPRGKMFLYAFFVQTCREEHKKKHPDASVNFSEFSKKYSEGWKTLSAKEKGKFEDMAKADKARYEREMKTYVPPKGETKMKFKDPNAPKRPPLAFFLFCSEYRPKIRGEHPGLSIGDVAKTNKRNLKILFWVEGISHISKCKYMVKM
ncbi:high mobility group protein B1-like [Microtus oregoni]|uniref:high mobility group protein B1-like n=1 Tax=Microtus oregoni TaxID=111838 RepID=UPI001BB27091|nr:high mobility group protein B1-like [Microtus oregoni]